MIRIASPLLLVLASWFSISSGIAQSAKAPTGQSEEKTLWNSWYTVSVEGDVPYGYYNDRVIRRGSKLLFQNQFWKKENDVIVRENLGAISEDDQYLTPLFFNFQRVDGSSEIKIDGSIESGTRLKARVTQGEQSLPVIERTIPKQTILSAFFPIWISKQKKELESGKTVSFTAVMEDAAKSQFKPTFGRVRLDPPDAKSKKEKLQKLTVDYTDQKSTWYLTQAGEAVQIDMPQLKMKVRRVTQKEAEKFLK